jgi:uncharacterized damage-inducible protein DinB
MSIFVVGRYFDPHPTVCSTKANNDGFLFHSNIVQTKGKKMQNLLLDLYHHQEGADALHWRAIENFPVTSRDEEIHKRLYHIHLTQYGFLCIAGRDEFVYKRFADFRDIRELKEFAIENHKRLTSLVGILTPAELDETVTIPWFKDPPLSITRQNALLQATFHSHYHRGQNATRLRALGGDPP